MKTLKEKVEILKSLETGPFDPARISEYLSYAITPQMAAPILKRILIYLIECDSQISASYEIIQDEEWDLLVSDKPILEDSNMDLKTKIDCLTMHFNTLYKAIESNEISLILELLNEIFKVKTKNIQFLLFLIAKKHSKQVFAYLLAKMKKNPMIYAPFFSSLLVRLRFDPELKEKCFNALKRHLRSLIPTKTVNYLIILQSFLYLLCFKEFDLDKESLEIFTQAYYKSLIPALNKDVVQKFMEHPIIVEKNFRDIVFSSLENSCFYSFPFDLPIIPRIAEKIQEDFIQYD